MRTMSPSTLDARLPARERMNEGGEDSGAAAHTCNRRRETRSSSPCPLSVLKKSSATSVPTRCAAIAPAGTAASCLACRLGSCKMQASSGRRSVRAAKTCGNHDVYLAGNLVPRLRSEAAAFG